LEGKPFLRREGRSLIKNPPRRPKKKKGRNFKVNNKKENKRVRRSPIRGLRGNRYLL